jgi:hypothetical protein
LAKKLPLQGECPQGEGVDSNLLRVTKHLLWECPQGEGVDSNLLRVTKHLLWECPQGEGDDPVTKDHYYLLLAELFCNLYCFLVLKD